MNILALSPIILIIIAVIVFLITRKILKALGFILLILLMAFFLSSILVYKDMEDYKERFYTEEKLMLLKSNENYVAGFVITYPREKDSAVLMNNQNINHFRQIKEKEILGDSYKILTFEISAFEELKTVDFKDIRLTKKEIIDLINSEDTFKDASEIILNEKYEDEEKIKSELKNKYNINDESELRSLLFSSLVAESVEENSLFLINKIKSKDIKVYPRTAMFIAISFIPESLFDVLNKGNEIKDKVIS